MHDDDDLGNHAQNRPIECRGFISFDQNDDKPYQGHAEIFFPGQYCWSMWELNMQADRSHWIQQEERRSWARLSYLPKYLLISLKMRVSYLTVSILALSFSVSLSLSIVNYLRFESNKNSSTKIHCQYFKTGDCHRTDAYTYTHTNTHRAIDAGDVDSLTVYTRV
jgi:hypothetical protein